MGRDQRAGRAGDILGEFEIGRPEMKRIIRDFHREMAGGLRKKPSSLKMLSAFVGRPTGREKGDFMALDLGGTNFRVLEVRLNGRGRLEGLKVMKFAVPKSARAGDGKRLFGFLARSVRVFLRASGAPAPAALDLGFTFSFPTRQRGIANGDLVVWTKGFRARGVVGRDVVALLEDALAREGLGAIRVRALANDTVGTLAAGAYADPSCDTGVIIGTGTNACYVEDFPAGAMIVNIEWGNFNRLRRTRFDRKLDSLTENRGRQTLEKMVSGMYLGEIARLVLLELAKGGRLSCGRRLLRSLAKPMSLKSEWLSEAAGDRSGGQSKTGRMLRRLGAWDSSREDRAAVKAVCRAVSLRAARIAAAAVAAVVTHMDAKLAGRHTVAIDGSVYEKHPGFSSDMKRALGAALGAKASKIRLVLTKDGSGKGAAIIAAVASSQRACA
jgi:hexokinase